MTAPALTPKWEGAFARFEDWVNHASSWLAGPNTPLDAVGQKLSAVCVDAKGRRCFIGADFMRARDDGAFPVYFFWECEPRPDLDPTREDRKRRHRERKATP
jgi:hypothetical protein